MIHIPDNSPLRNPPEGFSRRQCLVLDGLRYAAEMADIAYERLSAATETFPTNNPAIRDTAGLMLDAWSIIDSAHRFKRLLANLTGLPNAPWRRTFEHATTEVTELRNALQHQTGEITDLIQSGGQIWGYLSWAETIDGRPTGNWRMAAAGSDYVGDNFLYMGPAKLPYVLPPNRIRLNAFGQRIYLGRLLSAIEFAVSEVAKAISEGAMPAIGAPAAVRRGADMSAQGGIEVLIANPRRKQRDDPPTG